ncbi:MAG: hypothetical protein WD848_09275, partial [Dehalococcoidia bacterium]
MQERLNINISSIGQADEGLTITNAVRGLVLARAAESENLELLTRAVAACAKREASRTGVVFGENSIRATLTRNLAESLEASETKFA